MTHAPAAEDGRDRSEPRPDRSGQWRCALAASLAMVPLGAGAETWTGAWDHAASVPGSVLAWILALCAAELALHAVFVLSLVRSTGRRATLGQAYHTLMLSQCANALTPFRAGLPLRVYLYHRLFGIAPARGTALIAVETAVIAAVPGVLAGLGVWLLFPGTGLAGPALVLGLLGLALLVPWLYPHALFARRPQAAWARLGHRVGRFLKGVGSGLRRTPAWVVLAGCACVLASVGVQSARLDAILGELGGSPGLGVVAAAFSISFTLGAVSMLPLGIGVRDATLVWLLADAGVGAEAIAVAAVAQRLFSPGMYVLLGVFSGYRLGLRHLLRKPALPDD